MNVVAVDKLINLSRVTRGVVRYYHGRFRNLPTRVGKT